MSTTNHFISLSHGETVNGNRLSDWGLKHLPQVNDNRCTYILANIYKWSETYLPAIPHLRGFA